MKEKDKTKIYDSIQTGEVQTFHKTLQEVWKTKNIPGDYLRRKVVQLLQNKEHKTTISKYLKDTGRTELWNISNEQLEKINEAETQTNLRIPQFINYLMQATPWEKVINTQSSYNKTIESHYGPTEEGWEEEQQQD
jgi:predicted metal-dependent hydrolase